MKIYIASAYSRREEMAHNQKYLRNMGFALVSRWVDGLYANVDTSRMNQAEFETFQAGCARADMKDMANADMIICFTHDSNIGSGHHVEFGFMQGRGKRMVVVGPRLNVFHYHDQVIHFMAFEQLVDWIVRFVEVEA